MELPLVDTLTNDLYCLQELLSHQLARVGSWCHAGLKVQPLDASPHGDGLSGGGCRWGSPPQWVDEAPELQGYVHFCGGAKDDGGAAEDGHLANG